MWDCLCKPGFYLGNEVRPNFRSLLWIVLTPWVMQCALCSIFIVARFIFHILRSVYLGHWAYFRNTKDSQWNPDGRHQRERVETTVTLPPLLRKLSHKIFSSHIRQTTNAWYKFNLAYDASVSSDVIVLVNGKVIMFMSLNHKTRLK